MFAMIGATILAALAPMAAAQDPFPTNSYAAGAIPQVTKSGDINNDGIIDSVSIVYEPGALYQYSLSSHLGNASGGFAAPQLKPVVLNSSLLTLSLSMGDLTNDGFVDAVVALPLANGAVHTFPSDHFASFGNPFITNLPLAEPTAIATADLDSDGNLDVVTAHRNTTVKSIIYSRGNGSGFVTPQAPMSAGLNAGNIIIADVNHDSRPDLICSNTYRGIEPFPFPVSGGIPWNYGTTINTILNLGGGSFSSPIPSQAGRGPDGLATGDANADGNLDLFITNTYGGFTATFIPPGFIYITPLENKECRISLGNGSGSFPVSTLLTFDSVVGGVASGDLNGDNFADLLITIPKSMINNGSVRTMLSNGSGGVLSSEETPNMDARAGFLADVNGDNRPEFIFGSGTRRQLVRLTNNGTGQLFTPVLTWQSIDEPSLLAVGDYNMDGHPDLAMGSQKRDEIFIKFNDGNGGYTIPYTDIYITAGQLYALGGLAAGDLNQDGKLDLFAAHHTVDFMNVLLGDGAGGFVNGQVFTPAPGSYIKVTSAVCKDVNSDGSPDIVLGTPQVRICANDGFGNFSLLFTIPNVNETRDIRILDFDLDGAGDILTFNMEIYRGAPNGTFAPPVTLPTIDPNAPPYYSRTAYAAADINHDELPDIVSIYSNIYGQSQVQTFLNLGNMQFQQLPISGFTNNSGAVELADMDGDGNLDLVSADHNFLTLQIQKGDGFGNFSLAFDPLAFAPANIAIVDFNGDGRNDMLITDSLTPGTLSNYINKIPAPSGTGGYGSGTPGCTGRLGLAANSAPFVANSQFAILGTNAPARSLGGVIAADAQDFSGTDWFSLNLLIHVNPVTASQFIAYETRAEDSGDFYLPVPIPNDNSLNGMQFFIQALYLEATADGRTCSAAMFDLVSSRGLSISIP